MLIELTSAYTGDPVAIDHAMIGIVRPAGTGKIGTYMAHAHNSRRHWWVRELYHEVMAKIRAAERTQVYGEVAEGIATAAQKLVKACDQAQTANLGLCDGGTH